MRLLFTLCWLPGLSRSVTVLVESKVARRKKKRKKRSSFPGLAPSCCSAAAVPCNPLYFCIPVTVAASTTLVLPTTSFAMAYVYDRFDIGPWSLVRIIQ
ncbi:hypothetical protein HPB50_029620 [Hyalomma asiaticum]|nr:hypothetical protein HPB50_029620 [Hyalomma asiaticum]